MTALDAVSIDRLRGILRPGSRNTMPTVGKYHVRLALDVSRLHRIRKDHGSTVTNRISRCLLPRDEPRPVAPDSFLGQGAEKSFID